MTRRLAFATFLVSLLGSCAAAPADAFTLEVRLISIDPAVVDEVRISIRPNGTGERFQAIEPQTYENGQIQVEVATDGVLEVTIAGDHVRAHSRPSMTGVGAIYDLEIWSDDPMMRSGPRLVGTAIRTSEAIGSGNSFLPAWPPVLGASSQLAIQCTPAAVSSGRCMP